MGTSFLSPSQITLPLVLEELWNVQYYLVGWLVGVGFCFVFKNEAVSIQDIYGRKTSSLLLVQRMEAKRRRGPCMGLYTALPPPSKPRGFLTCSVDYFREDTAHSTTPGMLQKITKGTEIYPPSHGRKGSRPREKAGKKFLTPNITEYGQQSQ